MCSGSFLDAVSHQANLIRNYSHQYEVPKDRTQSMLPLSPFGGIQLVFAGDFGQLPPIFYSERKKGGPIQALYRQPLEVGLASLSHTYANANTVIIFEYIDMLLYERSLRTLK